MYETRVKCIISLNFLTDVKTYFSTNRDYNRVKLYKVKNVEIVSTADHVLSAN